MFDNLEANYENFTKPLKLLFPLILENQLQTVQQSFCLNSCVDQGGLVWKLDWELTLGIIAGQSPDGKIYVINNQPSLRNYAIQPLFNFHNKYCFYDLQNPSIDNDATTLLAFELLKEFNSFNGQSYLKNHKIHFPTVKAAVPKTESKKMIIQPKMLVPQKINQIAAPILEGTQLATDSLLNWFQQLFIPKYNNHTSHLPAAQIRRIRPSFLKSTSEKTA